LEEGTPGILKIVAKESGESDLEGERGSVLETIKEFSGGLKNHLSSAKGSILKGVWRRTESLGGNVLTDPGKELQPG